MRTRISTVLGTVAAAALLAACGSDAETTAQDHNAADVSFATEMIPHHRQALEMAEMASTRASSPDVVQLAEEIAGAQDPEIETMSGWLEAWGEPVPEEMGGMEMGGMPGMMSEEQMRALEGASGAAFDEMFLEMMIEHHTGAIQMAQTEQSDGQYPEAIDLAEQIEEGQTAEVETMQDLLGTNE
ncbi:MAG: DUF305 domain-containing protein [Geodermatophilaceae bacterium]|nr:DUF305 domain-containing protein [Geodermatophilaceae bacterium]